LPVPPALQQIVYYTMTDVMNSQQGSTAALMPDPETGNDDSMMDTEGAALVTGTTPAADPKNTTARSTPSTMQALEIDTSDQEEDVARLSTAPSEDDEVDGLNLSDDMEDLESDMEGLLSDHKEENEGSSHQKNQTNASAQQTTSGSNKPPSPLVTALLCCCCCCCSQTNKIGNTTVFWPSLYRKTGWGMMGPHWFGPPTVLTLLWSASYYFIQHAFAKLESSPAPFAWAFVSRPHFISWTRPFAIQALASSVNYLFYWKNKNNLICTTSKSARKADFFSSWKHAPVSLSSPLNHIQHIIDIEKRLSRHATVLAWMS